jgi:hypothetical protein
LLQGPLADGAIGGQVRPGPQRPGGLAGNVHRDQRPPLPGRAQVAVDQLGQGVNLRAGQVGDQAGRLAERQLGHPLGDLGGVDRLEPGVGRGRDHRESCQRPGHRQDQVVELGGAQRGLAEAGLLEDPLGGELHAEVAEQRPVDRAGLRDPVPRRRRR